MHSIRVKITAITIAAILTGMLSVFAVCFFTVQKDNDRRSVEIMNLLTENTRMNLEKYFESIQQSVVLTGKIACDSLDSIVLVENGAVGSGAADQEQTAEQSEALDAYLKEYSKQVQETFASVASHTHGIVTYYYCLTPDISENEHGFFYSRVGKTGFGEREPLDARELDPEDIEHTTWYYTPIERGRPSWVGPYTAHFLNEMWICSYLVPIYKSGSLIGVLGMDIPLDTLTEQITSVKVFDTGFACLCDEEGRLFYHPDFPMGNIADIPDLADYRDILKDNDSGEDLIRYTADGEERQMSFTTLPNGMKLVITAPTREITASWINLARTILFITVVITVLYAFVLFFVMRVLTRPLQRLTAASAKLAAGDYDVELDYHSRDEIGTLTGAFVRMRDRMKDYIEDLNRRIYTDDLTGLPNMRYFFRLAEEERDRINAEGKNPIFVYFNLIGMKHFNRQYGFEEGDALLCEFARILKQQYGENHACRISQDHFAAVTEETELKEGLAAIFREVQEANGGRSLPVRAGIYEDRLETVPASVACDRAKYACNQDRGAYVSGWRRFGRTMIEEAENVRYITNHIDQALKENWIQVHYQPIIRAASGRVCDEEALSRWFDPEKGMLPPSKFIPVLEEARLIYKLDLYVLDRVLEKMLAQKEAGLELVPQSLNLSRSDFDSCDIVEEICRRIDAAGIPRKMLSIEITESIVGSDFDFMKEQILRFKDLGFPVWMDDFGSGYSSLDVLQEIRFDLIKLDMRFLKRFHEGDESRIIITELVRMASGLGMEIIAEGVETKEQVDFLKEIGCTKLQGFYYGKAISFEELLERNRKGIQIGFEKTD